MNKQVTHKEKLEFVKKFNSDEFQNKFNETSETIAKIGIHSTMISIIISIICGIFNPWLFLLLVSSLSIPPICVKVCNLIQNKAIQNLNENLTLKDVEQMKKTGEWKLFEKELKYQEKQEKEKTNSKQTHEKTSQKQQVKRKKYVIDENLCINYSLLSNFAKNINCSLKEFSPLIALTNDSYFVVLSKNNIDYKFEVSNKGFIGIYESEGINFTDNWLEFLENKKPINTID